MPSTSTSAHAEARVLLRGGTVLTPEHPEASAMLTVGGRVAQLGDDADARAWRDDADTVVDLDGRLVTPGFVDAHVHLSRTGFAMTSLDLRSTSSLSAALDRLAEYARTFDGAVLFAHGWDETKWPEARPFTGAELDRAVGEKIAYASRIDAHSAVVSTALVDRGRGVRTKDGWHGDGVVERDSHHAARDVTDTLWTRADRERAVSTALLAAARTGITSVHEANAPHIAPYDDARLVRDLRRQTPLPEVASYWGALRGGENADDQELAGFAGDLCIDGALGSHTAALCVPYSDADASGHLYLDETEICEHVVWCTERGVQAGFHVIGDRGVDAAVSGFTRAADRLGPDAIFAAHHRLEHAEMLSPAAIAVLARFGVVASVQPAFDAEWGGPGGLYERRLGATRASTMNPFASMKRAGIQLAFGSDSPVTPMDPWAAVRAAAWHCNPDERLSPVAAFAAHTQGGHRARRDDRVEAGRLMAGATASYAVWDWGTGPAEPPANRPEHRLPVLDPGAQLPGCVRTVVAGTTVFDAEEDS